MLRKLSSATNDLDRAFFFLRWLILVGFSVAIIAAREPATLTIPDDIRDVGIAFGIGALLTILLGIAILIPALRSYAVYIQAPGDWIILGVFAYAACAVSGFPAVIDESNLLLLTGMSSLMMVAGVLRLGAGEGLVYGVGVLFALGVPLMLHPSAGMDRIVADPFAYLQPFIFAILIGLLTGIWSNTFSDENRREKKQLVKAHDTMEERVNAMQDRVKLVAEMTTRLNSSLNFEAILDATVNIGRLSLKNDRKQRTVSMVLMVESEDRLTIAASSGLRYNDEQITFKGYEGIIARTLDDGYPILGDYNDVVNDPELKRMNAFRDVHSVLSVPLRAGFDSYGLVIFGSTRKNAFNRDSLDTLKALGVQATMALQNAILYTNLMQERDRLISIEESARKALVKDLHDVPTQTMSAVAMHLSLIPTIANRTPEKLQDEVDNIRGMALRAVEEIRMVLFTLRPLSLETQGLGTALQQLADKMKNTYKQPMETSVDPFVEDLLDQNKKGQLFYLMEEAANNARKYAKASMIRAEVKVGDHEIIARVMDNGVGLPSGDVGRRSRDQGSFGMINMQERAQTIGGEFDIQSRRGKGTSVTVRIEVDTSSVPRPPKTHKKGRQSIRETGTVPRVSAAGRTYSGPISPAR